MSMSEDAGPTNLRSDASVHPHLMSTRAVWCRVTCSAYVALGMAAWIAFPVASVNSAYSVLLALYAGRALGSFCISIIMMLDA